MKKVFITLLFITMTINLFSIDGALTGKFTVDSYGNKVVFSKGNLQYQASTKTYRFAENQYDMIGENNTKISDTYDGWIDLFGWGTGNNPTLHSTDNADYTSSSTYTFPDCDWGINPIANGGNFANQWRSLTYEEWNYIFYGRGYADYLKGQAIVNNVHGYILLPDDWDWTTPSGHIFTIKPTSWADNIFTLGQWQQMESAGAVFLPCAGFRHDVEIKDVDSCGYYWFASKSDENNNAYSLLINEKGGYPYKRYSRCIGQSIRLVSNICSPAREYTETACDKYKWYLNDSVYTSSQDITRTFVLPGGCDKTDILHLTINTSSTGFEEQTAIGSYNWHGEILTKSGDYQYTLTNAAGCDSVVTLHLTIIPGATFAPEKTLTGKFTINDNGDQIVFSQGALQYNALAGSHKTIDNDKAPCVWQFSENQWDPLDSDNEKASADYYGWIDVLYWGTSGYNNKYPWLNSGNAQGLGDGTNDITGTNYDWGVYNAINNGGNEPGRWRTLTTVEWNYIISQRTDAESLIGQATVNDTYGAILLPDNFVLPNGLTFTPTPNNWTTNIYSNEKWAKMENAGAVFLPASLDTRMGFYFGRYWTSSIDQNNMSETSAGAFNILSGTLSISNIPRNSNAHVRLVQDIKKTDVEITRTTEIGMRKFVKNGNVFISHNGKIYNILGVEVEIYDTIYDE